MALRAVRMTSVGGSLAAIGHAQISKPAVTLLGFVLVYRR
jgi:hypothetical protein